MVIMPWNLRDEITAQLGYVRDLGRPVRGQPAQARGLLIGPAEKVTMRRLSLSQLSAVDCDSTSSVTQMFG